MPRRYKIFYCLLVVVLVGSFLFFQHARSLGVFIFGGKVITAIPCTCSGNFLVTISPPIPGQFVYYMGTQGFQNYNMPLPGIWALGEYVPGGVCLMYAGKGCVNFGAPIGTISPLVGTSIAF